MSHAIRCIYKHWIYHTIRMQHQHRSIAVIDDFGNLINVLNAQAEFSLN